MRVTTVWRHEKEVRAYFDIKKLKTVYLQDVVLTEMIGRRWRVGVANEVT